MKEVIPIFPLKIVAFPGELLSLHIFEPRYKELIQDCKNEGISFGLTPTLDNKLMSFGTELHLNEIVHEYPDGKFDIRCKGHQTYKQGLFYRTMNNKAYPGGIIERMPLKLEGSIKMNESIISLLARLYEHMKIKKVLPNKMDNGLSFSIGHHIGLNQDQECVLLSLATEQKRQKMILHHLQKFVPTVIEQDELRKRIMMNGHFRNLRSPDLWG